MNVEILKNILACTSSICTILQFLTGILVCKKIINKEATGEISSFPFVSGCLSTCLWLSYGFLIKDNSLIIVNTLGAILFLSYTITFFIYSIKKSIVLRQFIVCTIIFMLGMFYTQYEPNKGQAIKAMGLLCCIVTVMFFAAPLATLLHVVKVKSTESLPYPIILSTFIVSIQWFLYGLLLNDTFIQVPNFLGCILSGFQLSLFYIYPSKYTSLLNV